MVKLTVEMVTKITPGHNKRRPDETIEHYLARLTHIYYQDRSIDEIVSMNENIEFCLIK
jgi:protein phosphatase 1 regulatory subunit 42